MKRIISGAATMALAVVLAACGGAPNSADTSGTAVSGVDGVATTAPVLEPTVASDLGDSASEAYPGLDTTSTAGDTSATSTAGDTTGTTTAPGTTGTTTAPDSSATSPSDSAATGESVVSALAADPRFSMLTMLLEDTGLASQLETAGPVTIFAPTDEAFEALPAGTLDTLSQDPLALEQILLFHVAPGALPSSEITADTTAPTLAGEDLSISLMAGEVMVNETATVVEPDISAGSSVVHAIDQVLLPSTVASAPVSGS
jgi:uncharacterized surface protein with fasciclin (FAS1) repeats